MVAILSSNSGVSIISTDIVTDGVDRDVVTTPAAVTILFFTVQFDLNMINWSDRFRATFQIERYPTGNKTNAAWTAPLAAIPQSPQVWLSWTDSAAGLGIVKSGVYLYRPTFEIGSSGDVQSTGESDFAVAEEHYLLLETGW
jgi:hypothetical protein